MSRLPLPQVALDECWLVGVRARDRAVLEQLYQQYRAPVLHFLSLVEPGQSAAEACLDVFEEAWYGAVANPPQGTVGEWILSLAYCVLAKRAHSAQAMVPDSPGCILAALSWEERVVVALVYGCGLSLQSITKVTGMTPEEIMGHLGKACGHLRRVAYKSNWNM